jgi:hypothetical protein
MRNISKIRRSVSIKLGLLAIVLCLITGLVMDMRPFVILERTFICYIAFAMLGYILVSIIGGCVDQALRKRQQELVSAVEAVSKSPDMSEEKSENEVSSAEEIEPNEAGSS